MTENSRNQREMAQLTELHSEWRETFSENEMIRGMQGRKPGTVQVWMPAAPFQTIAGTAREPPLHQCMENYQRSWSQPPALEFRKLPGNRRKKNHRLKVGAFMLRSVFRHS